MTSDELLALLSEHRDPRDSPSLTGGRLVVPRDWKTLPQSAVIWRRADLYNHGLVVVGETVLTHRDGGIVAFDGRSGEELWARPSTTDDRAFALRGCEGTALLFEPTGLVAVDAASGDVRWSRPLEPRADRMYTTPGFPRLVGCQVAFLLVKGTRQLAETEPSTLIVVDADGTERTLAECPHEHCLVRALPGADGVVLAGGSSARFVPSDGGTIRDFPSATQLVVGDGDSPIAVQKESDTYHFGEGPDPPTVRWRATRGETEVWNTTSRLQPLGRLGDDLVVLRSGDQSIARIDLHTGEDRWALPLDEELYGLFARLDGRAIDGTRLAIANRTEPDLLLLVDLETGRPEALRLAPQDPVEVRLSGNLLLIGAHDEVVAVRVDREAPALRERLPLSQDIAQSVAELREPAGRPPEATRSGHIPAHVYPAGSSAARQWLARLGPLARPTLTEIVEEGDLDEVARAVPVFSAMEGEGTGALTRLALERSLQDDPTAVAARLRSAAAEAHGQRILTESLAYALATNAIRWLRIARSRGWLDLATWRSCPQGASAECDRMRGVFGALAATRDLLERSSTAAAPLRRLREEIAGERAHPRAGCSSRGAAAARVAVVTHVVEMSLVVPELPILTPGLDCAPVMSFGGPVEVTDAETTERRPFYEFGPAEPVEIPSERRGHAWKDARTMKVTWRWYSGPLAAQGGEYIVAEIGGLWRVVSGGMAWVS